MDIKPLIRAVQYYGEEVDRTYDFNESPDFSEAVQVFLDATQNVDSASLISNPVEDVLGMVPDPHASPSQFDKDFMAAVFDPALQATTALNDSLEPLFAHIKTHFRGRDNLSFKDLAELTTDPMDQVLLGHVVIHECFREVDRLLGEVLKKTLTYQEASREIKKLRPYLFLNYQSQETVDKKLLLIFDTADQILCQTDDVLKDGMSRELKNMVHLIVNPELGDRLCSFCHVLTLA